MSGHKTIFKSASVIGIFTIISRITGFARDVLIANLFGTGACAQAFLVAFKIPNVLRDIIGEGAGNAAFVPVFCESLAKKNRADFLKLVNSLLLLLLIVSSVISLAGIIFSSSIVRMVAPGFIQDKLKFDLTVGLNRVLFPYLILITLSAYFMSVSNALNSFAVPASSSVIYNVVLIGGILLISKQVPAVGAVYILSFMVLFSGVVQVLVQMPPLWKLGVNFGKGGTYKHIFKEESVRKVGKLMLPRLVGTSIYQLNVFIDTIFASLAFFTGEGAVAAIYYANRIIQFPFSVFGVALSNAALPSMSSASARNDTKLLKETLSFCLKIVFLGIMPLMFAILAFSYPLVQVIFQRGEFSAYSSLITSKAVFFYSLGLMSYIGVRFLSNVFYALQDTATPVKTSAMALVSNIFLNSLFVFVFKMQVAGLALASSISATLNFCVLYKKISNKTGFVFGDTLRNIFYKSFAASFVMIILLLLIWHKLFLSRATFINMFFIFFIGVISYVVFLWILKVQELKEFMLWLQRKR